MMRDKIVKEALSWERTPYHSGARIKGVGTDCGQILIAIYSAVGLVEDFDVEAYPIDWSLHRSEEKYLAWIEKYAEPTEMPQKGDLVLYKFGRCVSHSGIIIDDDLNIIHALINVGVIRSKHDEGDLGNRVFGFYKLKGL